MKRILFQNIFSAVPIAIDRPRGIKLKRKQNAENSYNSKSSSEITPLASNCCAMCVESLCSITSPLPVCYIVLKPRRVFSRCFSIQKGSASLSGKAAPFSRLPIGMRTSYALLFDNTHFRQRLRCFLLIYTARRRAVGTKEHCFAKNGGACGRGFFAHFVFHFFLLRLVFLCTCDLESSLTANSIYGFQQISTLKA